MVIPEVEFVVWSILDEVVEDGDSALFVEWLNICTVAIWRVVACSEEGKVSGQDVFYNLSSYTCVPKSKQFGASEVTFECSHMLAELFSMS